MKRRNFLRLLALVPFAPKAVMAAISDAQTVVPVPTEIVRGSNPVFTGALGQYRGVVIHGGGPVTFDGENFGIRSIGPYSMDVQRELNRSRSRAIAWRLKS